MAGRRPKPTAAKIAAGNPGKRPLPKDEPQPERAGAPTPPSWLGQHGKRKWKELVPKLARLGLLTELDLGAFEALCSAYDRWRQAETSVKRDGMTYKKGGIMRKNPAISIAAEARKEYRQLAGEFGLTPASRGRAAQGAAPPAPQLPGTEGWPSQDHPNSLALSDDEGFSEDEIFGEAGKIH